MASQNIWGAAPLTEESGRIPTQPELDLVSGLASALWTPVDYVGRVARGESAVFDPESGHVSPEAIRWGASQAMSRLPSRYSAPTAALQKARGGDAAQAAPEMPGYRLSENVDNRAPMGSPYVPSQRAQNLMNDIANGPTSWDPGFRDFGNKEDAAAFADELGGFNQPRIYPGLSQSLGDRELRNSVFDALNGQDLYPAPVYTGWGR
jgi:hypothetical protein